VAKLAWIAAAALEAALMSVTFYFAMSIAWCALLAGGFVFLIVACPRAK
jgi:hypothetical protein